MSKNEILFVCSKCDAQYPKWSGRCSQCGAWSTIVESAPVAQSKPINTAAPTTSISFATVGSGASTRIETKIREFDRVLGGGMVPGSVMLLAGEPGNGKSTLAAQLAHTVGKTLYVSGEESAEQIKLRLDRLHIDLSRLTFLGTTDARVIGATIEQEKPMLAIIDSIQTMRVNDVSGEAGSLTQVRAAATVLTESAKRSGVPVIVIGQVTKDGGTAGPKSLEHLVDVVLALEGDRESQYRVLRAEKNRFGSTDEIGVFLMTEHGLKEVDNPSEAFVRERSHLSGSCMTCVVEGSRGMLVEVQALAHPTAFGAPVRRASGIDVSRLQMICAVLASRARLPLQKADVHINVVGGIRVKEPAADLAIALAIWSALRNTPLPDDLCAFGEVGLGGELRSVRGSDRRITEALRFGLRRVVSPPDAKTFADALTFITKK